MTRGLRRFLLILLLLYLVCSIANLVVAIRATHWAGSRAVFSSGSLTPAGWPSPPPMAWPDVTHLTESRAFAYRLSDARAVDANNNSTHSMEFNEFGWPFPVLTQVQLWWPWNDPKWATTTPTDSGLVFSWLGFFANPLLAALALWLLLIAPIDFWRRHRRRRRLARGQCLSCGYKLQGLVVCPECGARAPMRVA